MPYDRQSLYLTWGGRMGQSATSEEIWQCGLHLAMPNTATAPPAPTQAEVDSLWSIFANFHVDADTGIYPGCMMLWVKAARLDQAGAYVVEPVVTEFPAVPGGFDGSQSGATPQDSVVVTLWSGQTLGRANYGRFYIPWQATVLSAGTCDLAPLAVQGIAANAKTLIDALNTWAGTLGEGVPVVTPVVSNMSRVGSGLTKRVAQVRVGSIKDTQRRRRNALNELYETLPITA